MTMQIDFSTKEFGFEVYKLLSRLNAFSRSKIRMVDENGVEWFRYNKELHDFEYEKFSYIGKREIRSFGQVDIDDESYMNDTEYYLKNEDGEIEQYHAGVIFNHGVPEWYETEEEVKAVIKKLELIDKEIDRK